MEKLEMRIRDNKTGKKLLTDHLEIIIVEIPKAIRQYKKNEKNKICQWMLFFDDPNKEELKVIMEDNKKIKEAVQELRGMSEDEELRILAELREKGRRDDYAARQYAIKEGRKKGIKEGRKEGRKEGIQEGRKEEKVEIAKNMLSLNIDIETISKVTGLKNDEILKLK